MTSLVLTRFCLMTAFSGLVFEIILHTVLSVIQSVLLYGCKVYHSYYSIPNYLSSSLERVQKRALKIIYRYDNHYRDKVFLINIYLSEQDGEGMRMISHIHCWISSLTSAFTATYDNNKNC